MIISAGKDFLASQRLLILAPHADDEAFGCAGMASRIKPVCLDDMARRYV